MGGLLTPRPHRITPGKETQWPIWTDAENLAPTRIRFPDRPLFVRAYRNKRSFILSAYGLHNDTVTG